MIDEHNPVTVGRFDGDAYGDAPRPDESFTTVELKINFLRPIWQVQLRAEGVVVQRGWTIG